MKNTEKFFDPIEDTGLPVNRNRGRKPKDRQNKKNDNTGQIPQTMHARPLYGLTQTQTNAIAAWQTGKNLVLHGVAGSGKTYLGIALAMKEIEAGRAERVVIIRSVVPTRDMGFLPGSLKDKIQVYETPYHSIFSQIYGRGDAYELLKTKGVVSFVSTSFMRGDTIDNAIVVVDECSNMTFHESDTVITRLGDNSRIIFCGDEWQSDLKYDDERSGVKSFLKILRGMDEFSYFEFTVDDIVRGQLVKSYIIQRLKEKR